jgi:acylphosphatase
MTPKLRIEIHVSGRVQGVGYRAFVLQEASRLLLRGWTRNLPNGDVQTIAEGSKEALEELLERLKEGPRYAEVMRHRAIFSEATGEFSAFTVRT